MRSKLAAVALVAVAVAGCSSGSTGATPAGSEPTPTPTFTQLGTLAISRVLAVHRSGTEACPAGSARPVEIPPGGGIVACDRHQQKVYLLAKPALDETAVDATTVAQPVDPNGWSVYLQLSKSGARAFAEIGGRYAVVFNGVVVATAPAVTPGGFVQITGLSKHKAKHIAADLNPS
jgi:preprotein translocase subunit SecD